MAALPDVPNVIRVRIVHTLGDDIDAAIHQFWAYSGSAPSIANLHDLNGFIEGFWSTWWKPLAVPECVLTGIQTTDLTTDSSAQAEDSYSVAGTHADVPLSASACVLVNYTVSRRYRGGKPRNYWPVGSQQDLQTPQTWKTSSITAFQAAVDGFAGQMSGQGFGASALTTQRNIGYYQGVILPVETLPSGRTKNRSKPLETPFNDQISSRVVNHIVGSQRRRYER